MGKGRTRESRSCNGASSNVGPSASKARVIARDKKETMTMKNNAGQGSPGPLYRQEQAKGTSPKINDRLGNMHEGYAHSEVVTTQPTRTVTTVYPNGFQCRHQKMKGE